MRARDVVGRKIVGIRQKRVWDEDNKQHEVDLEAIILDNGTSILFMTREITYGYVTHAWVHRHGK